MSRTHLRRDAYLYVRQSTLRQVFENTESTQRQYALRQHAVALGWPQERIIVIDCDLGQSGAWMAGREGFQRLVAEVGIGRAGIVLGLEVSRLARNCTDWHRLLEICALTDTLILDEDGLYDPAHSAERATGSADASGGSDRLRRAQVERTRYEAQLAERCYRHVDPANRLVADALEADWNQKLRSLAEAQQDYEHQRQADRSLLSEEERARILTLATDFPRLWRDAQTPDRERKRMVRLLLEDVTLLRDHREVTLHLRFKGGAHKTLRLPVPPNAWQRRATRPEVVAEMDRLLDYHTDREVATLLNQGGWQSGEGRTFTGRIVARIRRNYGLKSRYARLREAGLLTLREMAQRLGLSAPWVKIWRDQGLLKAQPYNDKNECLYEEPGDHPPRKMQGVMTFASERRLLSIENELTIAREIQNSTLPSSVPSLNNLRIAAAYHPMTAVAGDFYDLYSCGPQSGWLLCD